MYVLIYLSIYNSQYKYIPSYIVYYHIPGWWFQPSWKMMEFVNGKDYPIYYENLWKIKVMFQTTNQTISYWGNKKTEATKVPSLSEAPGWSAARHFVPHGELGRLRGFNGIL